MLESTSKVFKWTTFGNRYARYSYNLSSSRVIINEEEIRGKKRFLIKNAYKYLKSLRQNSIFLKKAEPEKERKIEYKKVIAVEPGETKEIEIDGNDNPILPDGAEKLEDELVKSEKDDERSVSEEAEPTSPRDLEVLPAGSMLSSIATMTRYFLKPYVSNVRQLKVLRSLFF